MCVAPFIAIGAAILLCLSPLALPLLPIFLVYWIREKRAGRAVSFRWRFGNADEAEAAAPAEDSVGETLRELPQPEAAGEPVPDQPARCAVLD